MFRFSASFPRLALGAAAALAAISLSPGSAQAFVVNVGGVQYDVTTFIGSYNDNSSKFALPPAPGGITWYFGIMASRAMLTLRLFSAGLLQVQEASFG